MLKCCRNCENYSAYEIDPQEASQVEETKLDKILLLLIIDEAENKLPLVKG